MYEAEEEAGGLCYRVEVEPRVIRSWNRIEVELDDANYFLWSSKHSNWVEIAERTVPKKVMDIFRDRVASQVSNFYNDNCYED